MIHFHNVPLTLDRDMTVYQVEPKPMQLLPKTKNWFGFIKSNAFFTIIKKIATEF